MLDLKKEKKVDKIIKDFIKKAKSKPVYCRIPIKYSKKFYAELDSVINPQFQLFVARENNMIRDYLKAVCPKCHLWLSGDEIPNYIFIFESLERRFKILSPNQKRFSKDHLCFNMNCDSQDIIFLWGIPEHKRNYILKKLGV